MDEKKPYDRRIEIQGNIRKYIQSFSEIFKASRRENAKNRADLRALGIDSPSIQEKDKDAEKERFEAAKKHLSESMIPEAKGITTPWEKIDLKAKEIREKTEKAVEAIVSPPLEQSTIPKSKIE